MTHAHKRKLIAQRLRAMPQASSRLVAAAFGVADKTVTTIRSQLIAAGEIPRFDMLVGADGKSRPAMAAADHTQVRETPEDHEPSAPVAFDYAAEMRSQRKWQQRFLNGELTEDFRS